MTPYARIQGSGNGSSTSTRSTVTADMLNPQSLANQNLRSDATPAAGPFYTSATFTFDGDDRPGDVWTLGIRNRDLSSRCRPTRR